MSRTISIQIIGDYASAERAFQKVSLAGKQFQGTIKEQAANVVVATVQQRTALQKLAAEYTLVSQNARRGSDVQLASAELAKRANQQLAASFGVVGAASRRGSGFGRTLDRDLASSTRGAIAASLSFRGLGRAASYASGYLIAGGGLVIGLKDATRAAIAHQATEAQLAAAVKNSGLSYAGYRDQIDKTLLSQERLSGFTEQDTAESFTKLLRTTRDVGKALNYTQLSMEIARGANIDLSAATNVVNKTLAGQTTGLRRLGVELPKGVSGYRALEIAGAKYGGSLAAWSQTAAGKQALLSQALKQTEVTIGTALLPTISKLSVEISDWLNKSGNQERIQRDVKEVVHDASVVFRDAAKAIRLASAATGGFKHVLEILLALKVVSWAMGTGRSLGLIGGEATAATGKVAGLRAALGGLGLISIAPIIIPIELKILDKGRKIVEGVGGGVGKWAFDIAQAVGAGGTGHLGDDIAGLFSGGKPKNTSGMSNDPMHDADRAGAGVGSVARSVAGSSSPVALDRLSRIQDAVAAARLAVARKDPGAQAQLTAALQSEIDYDRKYEAVQAALVAKGGKDAKKHAKTLQALQADETSALDEISGMAASTDTKARSAVSKADRAFLKNFQIQLIRAKSTKTLDDDLRILRDEEAALKARLQVEKGNQALRQALATVTQKITAIRQTQAQAATTFTVPMALRIAAAKASTTADPRDDIAVAEKIKAFAVATIRSNKKKGQALVDAWDEIAAQLQIIGQPQVQGAFKAASLASLTAGLGLSHADRLKAEARLAQAQAHSGYLPTGHGVLGQTISINNLHVHANSADEFVAQLKRKAKKGVAQRSGPHAGTYLGVH